MFILLALHLRHSCRQTRITMAKKKSKSTSRYAKSKMNPVVHFEIPIDNPKRVSKFYKKAFGWNPIPLGEEHGGYIIAQTGETTKDGMLKETGIINGGFYRKDKKRPAQYPTLVLAVADLKKAMKKIEKAGGRIIGKPEPIPGYGTYVSFYDTEGNRLEIIEPDQKWKDKTK